ncbi:esterase E4 [Solenopsis invicta]|uniref:esterase E4 n=1 Tax=Solenopsis invicta TaxID=13686 RepID=UPI00193D0B77|nr:esterase E4 [Solenopsis invicta]
MSEIKVQVTEGKLTGVVEDGHNVRYCAFRGIPYAKPPVGELRFKDPVPAEPWSGDRDASKHGNIAVQINMFTREIEGDEDCLYLNVYTTKIDSEKRPVMVWVHGGGFFLGSGNADFYGPDFIVKKDVVLVTINYRLDALGFLNLNDKVATGNQGLKDVVLALKWVKKNISNFGGNSENVTIFGESAGGGIVHLLALSPYAKGLFHKVIAQSGVATNTWAITEWTDKTMNPGFQLAEKLGKTTSDPKIAYEFLKTRDAKEVIQGSRMLFDTRAERLSFKLCFAPSLDFESSDPFFPEHPKEYISRGIHIPFLLGFTRNEGLFFVDSLFFGGGVSKEHLEEVNADFKKAILPEILSTFPEIGITAEELKLLYFEKNKVSKETLINYANFLGDEFFVRGVMDLLQIQKSTGGYKSTYLYQFDYENDNNLSRRALQIKLPGVSHTEELAYLFYPEIIKMFNLSLPESDSEYYKMINHLTQMWTDFATTGKPTSTNLWLPLTGPQNEDYNYLNIDKNSEMKVFRKGQERWDWENKK